jgi:1-aminocyclopropane-1-carboxylate deaminase/D-cysteine desulfhydrase-like pyridoxal-dependent ACC family enzyme
VYSGKTFAGLIALTHEGIIEPDWNVLFVHTGGTPALFAYQGLVSA